MHCTELPLSFTSARCLWGCEFACLLGLQPQLAVNLHFRPGADPDGSRIAQLLEALCDLRSGPSRARILFESGLETLLRARELQYTAVDGHVKLAAAKLRPAKGSTFNATVYLGLSRDEALAVLVSKLFRAPPVLRLLAPCCLQLQSDIQFGLDAQHIVGDPIHNVHMLRQLDEQNGGTLSALDIKKADVSPALRKTVADALHLGLFSISQADAWGAKHPPSGKHSILWLAANEIIRRVETTHELSWSDLSDSCFYVLCRAIHEYRPEMLFLVLGALRRVILCCSFKLASLDLALPLVFCSFVSGRRAGRSGGACTWSSGTWTRLLRSTYA